MTLWTAVLLVSLQSAYAGQEQREVKALSAEDVRAYLEGEGMGFAKAAELNHYPGPRHVLEQATALRLSDGQQTEIRRIYDRMHEEAVRLGRELVEKEAALDRLFAGGLVNYRTLDKSVTQIALVRGRLRAAHLRAHLATRAVLSAEQILSYDAIRGYHHGGGHRHPGSDDPR